MLVTGAHAEHVAATDLLDRDHPLGGVLADPAVRAVCPRSVLGIIEQACLVRAERASSRTAAPERLRALASHQRAISSAAMMIAPMS